MVLGPRKKCAPLADHSLYAHAMSGNAYVHERTRVVRVIRSRQRDRRLVIRGPPPTLRINPRVGHPHDYRVFFANHFAVEYRAIELT